MNLIDGAVKDGVFRANGVEIPVQLGDRDGVVLGIRPEELDITQDASAAIGGKLYALELTGESTLVTLRNGPVSACARGHADFEAEVNSPCYLSPKDGARVHLFDRDSGERLA
jgi:multiple sugar transport system ATP-binding protein